MISRQCTNCLHRIDSAVSASGGTICLAFPEGIPEAIQTGKVDHSKPYPGDNGFRYEPADPDLE